MFHPTPLYISAIFSPLTLLFYHSITNLLSLPPLVHRDHSLFHGIIFTRTRQGAHYLTDVLRAASAPVPAAGGGGSAGGGSSQNLPLLSFIQGVYVFVGHGDGCEQEPGFAVDSLVGGGAFWVCLLQSTSDGPACCNPPLMGLPAAIHLRWARLQLTLSHT